MRNIRYFYTVDQDGSAPFIVNGTVNANTDIRSQELHLASSTEGNLTWLAGLYYFYSRAAVEPAVVEGSSQAPFRSEEHTSELQSLMRISYAVFCLKKKNKKNNKITDNQCLHRTNVRSITKITTKIQTITYNSHSRVSLYYK